MRPPLSAPWSCPQCGRTVPAREPRCHCGVLRIEAPAAGRGDDEPAPSSSSVGWVVLAIVLVAAGAFGLYAAARQREQDLQAAAAAENERSRPRPPVREGARPGETAARVTAPIPDTFGGAPASPFPFPSARSEAAPLTTKGRPGPAEEASPSPTAMEEAWARASELLEPTLQKIAAETDELQQRYAPFAQACLAAPDGNWLVAMRSGRLQPSGMPFIKYGLTVDCASARRELVARGNQLKGELDAAETLAHSSRVLPGHWRKLLETHGLDIWDQY
jgi:hypothetical protein